MKRSIFLLMFVVIITLNGYSQNEPVVAKAIYHFTHKTDTTNLNFIRTENMILFLGKTSSMYKSYDRYLHDSIMEVQIKSSKGTALNVQAAGKLGSGSVLFLYSSKKKALQQEFLMNNYIYPIDFPVINWNITNDTLSISGQKCQKATGSWKGRTYEAWFCADIPFRSGPWKLTGLPGLIIKAYDLRREVGFELVTFQRNTDPTAVIAVDKKAIKTTKKKYHNLHEAFYENPTAFIKNSLPQGVTIKTNTPYIRKPAINNPLELEK